MTNTQANPALKVSHEHANLKGTITYDDKVIQKIVGHALESVDGLLAVSGGFFSNLKNKTVNSDNVTDGVNVEVGQKEVAVDLDIVAEYQRDIPVIVDKMKEVISLEVAKMTHLKVIEVNVNVVDVMTKEEYAEASVTLQDRVTDAAHATGEFASKQADNVKNAVNSGTEAVKERVEESRVN